MRRLVDEAASQKAERKEYLLQRRLVKVSAASETVASCLIANAFARKRERVRIAKAAVAMVRGKRYKMVSECRLDGDGSCAGGPELLRNWRPWIKV